MSAGVAPSTPSTTSSLGISTDMVNYLTQMQSIKYNNFRRNFDRMLREMKKMRDNITGAEAKAVPNSPRLYPSSVNPNY
jgi:hypothetical protein